MYYIETNNKLYKLRNNNVIWFRRGFNKQTTNIINGSKFCFCLFITYEKCQVTTLSRIHNFSRLCKYSNILEYYDNFKKIGSNNSSGLNKPTFNESLKLNLSQIYNNDQINELFDFICNTVDMKYQHNINFYLSTFEEELYLQYKEIIEL